MKSQKWNENWEFWNEKSPENKSIVKLPHDAMLTEKRLPNMPGGAAAGYFPGGKYFYRKKIFGSSEFENRSVLLEFQGVYMKSAVYLNGEKVGGRIYGYSRFYADLTGKLKSGEENEILVVVDNTQTPNTRWYSGSGIYRDVILWVGEKLHIRPDNLHIRTISADPPKLQVDVSLSEESENAKVETRVCTPDGTVLASGEGTKCVIEIPDAGLWTAETPNLYEIRITLSKDGKIIDEHREKTGIRQLTWSAESGICVNGTTVKLRGGCIHHDNGPLGACSFYSAELRRVKKLKEMGFNAIRYSHNPAGKAFLDACDAAGIYVIVEAFDAWKGQMLDYDYGIYFEQEWKKDLHDMIEVAYNHPSVIIYGIGNEISDTGTEEGAGWNQKLNDYCHELDDSRPTMHAFNPVVSAMGPVTKSKTTPDDVVDPYREEKGGMISGSLVANMIATVAPVMSKVMGKPEKVEKTLKPCFDHIDIVGYNYADQCYEPHHANNPKRLMMGSETYPWAIVKNWPFIESHPYVVGDFMWTAWDYLGEAGIGVPIYGKKHGGFNRPYPCISGGCGAFDLTGVPETEAYVAAITWGVYKKPYIGVRPVNHSGEKHFFGQWRRTDAVNSWSFEGIEGRKAEIEVYSIGKTVELWQDEKLLGKKELKEYQADFNTTYRKGTLRAVSYDASGKKIEESILKSAGKETYLTIHPEQSCEYYQKEDLIYFEIELTDGQGIKKMLSDQRVMVEVQGAGTLAGMCSSNPYTTDSFLGSEYETNQGRMIAVVRCNGQSGEVCVRATAGDLTAESVVYYGEK